MRYTKQGERFIFKDGEQLLEDLLDIALFIHKRMEVEGKTSELLNTFFNNVVHILGRASFEPVLPVGSKVSLKLPTPDDIVYTVKRYDNVTRRYFLTYHSNSFNGKSFGFWIDSDFVKSK